MFDYRDVVCPSYCVRCPRLVLELFERAKQCLDTARSVIVAELDGVVVEFRIFSGVSDNRSRWFDLEHARTRIGYDPHDDGGNWNAPPG